MLILKIKNISDLASISNYKWTAIVNGEEIDSGIVERHRRTDGWRELVRKIVTPKEREQE